MSITHYTHPIDPDRVALARSRLSSSDDADRQCSLLSLIADAVRLRPINALDVAEEHCVGDLAPALAVRRDSLSYAVRLLHTVGLLITCRQGRVVDNRLAEDFPAPLRDHFLRQLIALTHTADDTDGDQDTDESTATSRKGR